MSKGLISLLEAFPPVLRLVNRWLIGRLASSTTPRPHRFHFVEPERARHAGGSQVPGDGTTRRGEVGS